jgi:hypothetical protein
MQRVIALKQKLLVSTCHMEVQKQLQSPLPAAYRKITGLSWKPLFPQLHIQDKPGYEGEEGAPKVLSSDFVNSQNILIRGQYIPEKFLTRWKSTEALLVPIKFFTFAKIKMENIESGWSAQLASLPARDDFRGAFPRSSN